MNEIWKDIQGYEGLYQVSNLGRVKNLKRNKILKSIISSQGYITRQLYKNKIPKNVRIHRLVAEAFIPNPENKPQVNHIDGNKTNNCVSNLEWVNQCENMQHAVKNNLFTRLYGENARYRKLTNDAVLYIRKHYIKRDRLFGATALALKFGVSIGMISYIASGKSWKHI